MANLVTLLCKAGVLVALLLSVVLSARFGPATGGLGSVPFKSTPPLRVLLLTAHPDDEVMFFSPTIFELLARNITVISLCMSTGVLKQFTRAIYRAHGPQETQMDLEREGETN